jgi:hypothetical protein
MVTSVETGWIPYSSAQCQGRVGSYCYVPSWPVLKTDATQNPQRGDLICIREPLGMRRPELPFWVARLGGLVMESRPTVLNRRLVE